MVADLWRDEVGDLCLDLYHNRFWVVDIGVGVRGIYWAVCLRGRYRSGEVTWASAS